MIIPALADIQREKERRRLRGDFYAYRNHLDKKLKDGWWQRDIAMHLSEFKRAYFAGEAPRLVIQAPPQHGKSVQIVDFISWITGLDPSTKCIYASFSERLGVRANLKLQRIITSKAYQDIFPDTSISASSAVSQSVGFSRNREFIEFIDQDIS